MDHRTLQHLMRNPLAMANFRATGKAPQFSTPSSPSSPCCNLYPRERAQITAVRVNEQLGYQGGRQFHNAAQALTWLVPVNPGTHISASESRRIKRFQKQLTVDDLAQHARVPVRVIEDWWRRHPQLASLGNCTDLTARLHST